jgi:hypothetical protein
VTLMLVMNAPVPMSTVHPFSLALLLDPSIIQWPPLHLFAYRFRPAAALFYISKCGAAITVSCELY